MGTAGGGSAGILLLATGYERGDPIKAPLGQRRAPVRNHVTHCEIALACMPIDSSTQFRSPASWRDPRLEPMCRVCLRRPEIPDEPHGRCESCLKAGRRAYSFRLTPTTSGFRVSAGELSPRALRDHVGAALQGFAGKPAVKPHLVATQCDLVVAGKRLESIRIGPGLATRGDQVVEALRQAAARTDAAW